MPASSNPITEMFEQQIPREIDPASGLPVGPAVARADPAATPARQALDGQYCRLEPFDPKRHADQLYAASTPADAAAKFLYLLETAPQSRQEVFDWMTQAAQRQDPLFFAVIDKQTGRVEGRQALMRITPAQQCLEIGSIYWGPAIAGTRVATEANFLFAQYAFDQLGYRRYEWKCNALNMPSRRAALRFGFSYEGHFRRAMIIKGRSRDTSWFSIIDDDWPALKAAYQRWLAPENFDAEGRQKTRLSDLTKSLAQAR